MIEALLVVLSNAIAGRDDDFNDWYTHVHLRDALRYRGSLAVRRFRLSTRQPALGAKVFPARYLALYEVSDAERFAQEHFDNVQTPRMVIGDSFDLSRVDDYHYFLRSYRTKCLRPPVRANVIVEQIDIPVEKSAVFEQWYDAIRFPSTLEHDGIFAGGLWRFSPDGQLMSGRPSHSHVAVYLCNERNMPTEWALSPLHESGHVDPNNVLATFWNALIPRMTADEVHHPTSAGLAAEERARARLGDRVHRVRGALRD